MLKIISGLKIFVVIKHKIAKKNCYNSSVTCYKSAVKDEAKKVKVKHFYFTKVIAKLGSVYAGHWSFGITPSQAGTYLYGYR